MFVQIVWSVFCWEMLSLIYFRAFLKKSVWNAGEIGSPDFLKIQPGSFPAPITSCKKHGWLRLWWWKDGLDCWAGPKDFCLLSLLFSRVLLQLRSYFICVNCKHLRLLQGNIVFAFSALVEHLHTDHQFIIANRSLSVNPAMFKDMICLPWTVRLHMSWLRNTNYQRQGRLWMVVDDSWWWALKLIWSNLAPRHCYLSVSVCLCLTLAVWRPLLVQRSEHVQRGWEGWWFNPHPEATTRSKLTTIFPSQQCFNLYLCKHAHLMLMVNWSTKLSAPVGSQDNGSFKLDAMNSTGSHVELQQFQLILRVPTLGILFSFHHVTINAYSIVSIFIHIFRNDMIIVFLLEMSLQCRCFVTMTPSGPWWKSRLWCLLAPCDSVGIGWDRALEAAALLV